MLQRMINVESLENLQKRVYNGVYFNNVASLQYTDCNSTMNKF